MIGVHVILAYHLGKNMKIYDASFDLCSQYLNFILNSLTDWAVHQVHFGYLRSISPWIFIMTHNIVQNGRLLDGNFWQYHIVILNARFQPTKILLLMELQPLMRP